MAKPNPFELYESDQKQKATKAIRKAIQRAGKDIGNILRSYEKIGACDTETRKAVTDEFYSEMCKWL